MSAAVATVNIALGVVYLIFAALLVTELRRQFAAFGHSHLGYAFLALALTCGPHHLAHGLHVAEGAQAGAPFDLVATAIGLPIGAIWVALRIEAFRGGRGDRFVSGTPGWISALPTLIGMYFTAYVAALVARGGFDPDRIGAALSNGILIVTYGLIATYMARTQIANRRPLGGWSVSGLTLSGIFLTCSVMHTGHAMLVLDGTYPMDVHLALIDAISIPASLYFLWTVRALHQGRMPDWNTAGRVVPPLASRAVASEGAVALAEVRGASRPDPWARPARPAAPLGGEPGEGRR